MLFLEVVTLWGVMKSVLEEAFSLSDERFPEKKKTECYEENELNIPELALLAPLFNGVVPRAI